MTFPETKHRNIENPATLINHQPSVTSFKKETGDELIMLWHSDTIPSKQLKFIRVFFFQSIPSHCFVRNRIQKLKNKQMCEFTRFRPQDFGQTAVYLNDFKGYHIYRWPLAPMARITSDNRNRSMFNGYVGKDVKNMLPNHNVVRFMLCVQLFMVHV